MIRWDFKCTKCGEIHLRVYKNYKEQKDTEPCPYCKGQARRMLSAHPVNKSWEQ